MNLLNTGDTSWILMATALVFFMTPGLALFYGGMVRRKNVLNTIMSSFFIAGVGAILWVLVGYTLSFGKDMGGIIGSLQFLGFNGVGMDANSTYSSNIPHILFATFQMMFAIITPAVVTGAIVERMKFSSLLIFTIVWSLLIYYPLTHMVWGAGGLLKTLGIADFAGGTVVEINSGITALVASIILGKRKGYGMTSYHPHNIPLVFTGASILWFGWFGFNAGSALAANGLSAHAFATTNISAASAVVSWMFIEKVKNGKPTMLGAATGAVVGLVAITPACGFVPMWAAIIIGLVASPLSYLTITYFKHKFGFDDALDVFGCHGVGGIWGCLATGLFANTAINNSLVSNGLVFGSIKQFSVQFISVIITILFTGGGTAIILLVMRAISPIRVSLREETDGLDIAEHGESAYPSFTGMD